MELDTKQSDLEVNYHSETNNFKPFYGSYPGNIHGDSTSSTTTQFQLSKTRSVFRSLVRIPI